MCTFVAQETFEGGLGFRGSWFRVQGSGFRYTLVAHQTLEGGGECYDLVARPVTAAPPLLAAPPRSTISGSSAGGWRGLGVRSVRGGGEGSVGGRGAGKGAGLGEI